jgi:lipid A oxidase
MSNFTAAWLRSTVLLASLIAVGPGPAAAEVFLDGFVGKSSTLDSDVKIEQPGRGNDFTIEGLSFDDESFVSPWYYGARVGYFFEGLPAFGLGLEFFHFKILGQTGQGRRIQGTVSGAPLDTTAAVNTIVERFDVSHGVNYVTLDALLRYPLLEDPERFPRGRVQLYAGAGLGPVITHAETRIQNQGLEKYELAGLGVQGFLGVRALVFKHFGVFVEYKFTHSGLEFDVFGGRARVDENTHHTVGGLSIHFPSF